MMGSGNKFMLHKVAVDTPIQVQYFNSRSDRVVSVQIDMRFVTSGENFGLENHTLSKYGRTICILFIM